MMTTTARSRRRDRDTVRKGTPEEAARIVADFRRLSGVDPVECVECGQPARRRFGVADLCTTHATEAMATAYAMENAL